MDEFNTGKSLPAEEPFESSSKPLPRVRTVSLRVRLLALAALAMTIVIGERTVSLFYLHYDNLAAAESHVMDMLDRSVGHYEKTIAGVQAVLLTLATGTRLFQEDGPAGVPAARQDKPAEHDPPIAVARPESCQALLRVREMFPEIESLTIVGTDAIVQCGTAPGSGGLDLSARGYMDLALRGIPNIESVARSYVTDRPSLYAAQPIIVPEGRGIVGVLVARVKILELFPPSAFAALGAGTEAILVSPEGRVLLSYPDNTLGPGLDISNSKPIARALSRTRGTLLAEGPDGVQRVYAYARLPATNMHLLIGLDQLRVFGPVERATWTAGLSMLLAGLIVLLGLSLVGEKLIVGPIQSLAERLVRFGHGDKGSAEVTIVVTELQPLTVAFESMTTELTRRENALRNANRRLNSLASLDALTGIPNRRSFDSMLPLRWNTSPKLALLIVDIDHFKKFNDRYGHKEGDRCIRAVAQMLAAAVRGSDMTARVGGEEFAVLMPGADVATAGEVAERLRIGVEQLAIPHADLPGGVVTVSIGCAACEPSPELSPTDLYVASDEALYAAKHAGRNAVRSAEKTTHRSDTADVTTG